MYFTPTSRFWTMGLNRPMSTKATATVAGNDGDDLVACAGRPWRDEDDW